MKYDLFWHSPTGHDSRALLRSMQPYARAALDVFLRELVTVGTILSYRIHLEDATASYRLREDGPAGRVACATKASNT